jgi:demethylmenaquinone methyltransferase/2-methoxy-6-polyprenyl-1,4-benzoquinol methylase
MISKTELPLGDEKKQMVQTMFDDIAPTYETANRFISLGLDRRARKIALKELRALPHSVVIDLASGTGDFSRMLDAEGMIPLACDLSFGMLNVAKETNNRIQCDGTFLPLADASCAGVVCGYGLRNFVDLESLFNEIMRVLNGGSRFVAVDVSVPTNRFLKFFNRIWLGRIVPKIGWLISKNKAAYEYLPKSTAYLPSDDEIVNLLKKSGAENISVTRLYFGSLILISATKTSIRQPAIDGSHD